MEAELFRAASSGNLDTVRDLLGRGANIEAKDNHGRTSLIIASEKGRLDVVRKLLDRGANIAATENDGNTALIQASSMGKLDVVRELLGRGADVNAANRFGETSLIATASTSRVDIVKELLDRGANINAKDTSYGRSSLEHAANTGRLDIVRELLERGADIFAKNLRGETARTVAERRGKNEVAKLLLKKEEDIARTGISEINVKTQDLPIELSKKIRGYLFPKGGRSKGKTMRKRSHRKKQTQKGTRRR